MFLFACTVKVVFSPSPRCTPCLKLHCYLFLPFFLFNRTWVLILYNHPCVFLLSLGNWLIPSLSSFPFHLLFFSFTPFSVIGALGDFVALRIFGVSLLHFASRLAFPSTLWLVGCIMTASVVAFLRDCPGSAISSVLVLAQVELRYFYHCVV